MVRLLQESPFTARDLSRAVGIPEKEVYYHLIHIEKSLRLPGGVIQAPARCLNCGFNFRKRHRLTSPGRCPICRSEAITPPVYYLSKRTPNKPVSRVEAQNEFSLRPNSGLERCNDMNRSTFHDDNSPDFCEFKEDQLIPSRNLGYVK